ncbi:hypothetical protein [Vibrio scophthalmi]|uniref:Transcriptional regulator n=1 Tax=Vibrio scophthalmi TaxID=45658 RepID=A0A1E3WMG9_9VIBR|nr:hypothetical protein [Vibrio scophthalmi]ODS10956.1 hypothetical protein VSF3289_01217 [Vibrio scophthalmi]
MTWLDELRQQVDSASLGIVAKEMGLSKATISLVINGKYNGDMVRMQAIVESVYMGHTVNCPVLGEIPKHKCAAHQSAKHVGSTPNAIRLWKACRSGCSHSQLKERLNTPVRFSLDEPVSPLRQKQQSSTTERPGRQYDAISICARLERQAKTDADIKAGSYNRLYIDLLKRELTALGNRYNRLLKQKQ